MSERLGVDVLDESLDLPLLVLNNDALEHNLTLMAAFCAQAGLELAPHGKTTMAPSLFARQLGHGAWGITAATIGQVRKMHANGVPRILLANVLVEPAALRWVHQATDAIVIFYVDSEQGVEVAESALAGLPDGRRLPVLVELGYPAGRTGCRSVPDAIAVARRVAASPVLELVGVAGYEGFIPADEQFESVRQYFGRLHDLADQVHAAGLVDASPMVVSAGGSFYFDLVAECLRPALFAYPVTTVLRSGCYVSHDDGLHAAVSPLGAREPTGDPAARLQAALEVWAVVLSRPEPDLVIAGFGKRNASFDSGWPVPTLTRAAGGKRNRPVLGEFAVTNMNDQHAYVRIPESDPVAVGDRIACGISHACTTFDKWREILLVDEDYRVLEVITTEF